MCILIPEYNYGRMRQSSFLENGVNVLISFAARSTQPFFPASSFSVSSTLPSPRISRYWLTYMIYASAHMNGDCEMVFVVVHVCALSQRITYTSTYTCGLGWYARLTDVYVSFSEETLCLHRVFARIPNTTHSQLKWCCIYILFIEIEDADSSLYNLNPDVELPIIWSLALPSAPIWKNADRELDWKRNTTCEL